MWELSPHQIHLKFKALFLANRAFFERGEAVNSSKRKLFKITNQYAEKYELDDSYIGKTIILYNDRISHIERHRFDFSTDTLLTQILNDLSFIIANPDFITRDNKNNSLQIIKRMNDNVLIAVRISKSNELKVKTIYPINETKYNKLKNKIKDY